MRVSLVIFGAALGLASCATPPAPPPLERPSAWKVRVAPQESAQKDGGAPDAATERAITEYFAEHRTGSAPSSLASSGVRESAGARRYELNFQEAELKGVVDAILGDMLKLDYVVDPALAGRLTLRTGGPVSRDALLSALETALATVAVAIVPEGSVLRVLPMELAPQRARGAHRFDPAAATVPGYAVEIIPLSFVAAYEMQRVLDAFVPKGTVLQADDEHGHLVIAGTRPERAEVLRTVQGFDVDWLNGMNFALYRLESVAPEQLVEELRQVFQPPMNVIGTRVRLIPLPRVRAVLGIARARGDLELVESWVRRLDAGASGGRRLWVYSVQHGVAKDLVASLREVLSGVSTTGEQTMPIGTAAATAAAAAGQPAMGNPSANLVAVEESNSVLFYGREDEFRLIKEALREIDVFPRQVMIEAILAEVTLNDNLRYGVQWFFDSGENSVTLSASDVGAVASQFPGFSYVYSGRADARLVLNALQSKTDVRVLSAPKLAVLNNQKASLQVGDQVPVITQTSRSAEAPGAPIINSIQMRDTGVILEVTPRVNDNGNVTLGVVQEVSDVAQTTSSGIDSPTIQRRRIQTTVSTRNGYTVALGGLIRENGSRGNSGVPVLKDLPVIGNAFRNNTSEARRTELIVLLVPHVMRNQEETQSVVDALVDAIGSAARVAEDARPAPPEAH